MSEQPVLDLEGAPQTGDAGLLVAQVVLLPSPAGLPESLTYSIPARLSKTLAFGMPVLVPLGGRDQLGYVVSLDRLPAVPEAYRLRPIQSIPRPEPALDADAVRLLRSVAHEYRCSLAEALPLWVPERYGAELEARIHLGDWDGTAPARTGLLTREVLTGIYKALTAAGGSLTRKELTAAVRNPLVPNALRRARAEGWVREEQNLLPPRVHAHTVKAVHLASSPGHAEDRAEEAGRDPALPEAVVAVGDRAPESPRRPAGAPSGADPADRSPAGVAAPLLPSGARLGPRQAQVLDYLQQRPGQSIPQGDLCRELGVSDSVVRGLVRRGLLEQTDLRVRRRPRGYGDDAELTQAPELTPFQGAAADAIVGACRREAGETLLLFGVTGSGKTEVYLHAIQRARDEGRTAILLVPEISLTAQVATIVRRRLGDEVAILHSALSEGERFDEWERLRRGDADVVVGPRSALFAPLARPSLIILDEEHDGSYKQDSPAPRYHAREVARNRAGLSGGAVVLGSATPSVSTFYRATTGAYALLELPERVRQRPLPTVELVDLRAEGRARPGSVFGARLEDAMRERLARREQVILFLNRRGYSAFLLCRDCGHVPHCPNCDVSLTLHRHRVGFLLCHHCNYTCRAPSACRACSGTRVRQFGIGTQRVEAAVRQLFPDARVARLDRDTMGARDAHTRVVSQVRDGEIDILIGTQMVTKGFDFPGVTLVGVVAADIALNIPDYQAAERAFQLLTQVSGRAGRGDVPGEVVVQTFSPEHPAIQAASRHDYRGFYYEEIRHREELGYPPFGFLARLLSTHQEDAVARGRIEVAAELVTAVAVMHDVRVLGPVSCPLSRLQDRYRWHLLLKGPSRAAITTVLDEAWPRVQRQVGSVTVDVEPENLM